MLRAVRDTATTMGTLGLLLAVTAAVGVAAQPPAATPPAATQPPVQTPGTPVFRSGVDLVELDLRVVDGRGAPVTDLTAADVEVRENGVLQRVEDLMRVSLPLPPPASTRPPAGDARVYVIVLDDLHVDGRRTLDTRRLARAIVDRIVGPNDQAAVLYASGRTDAAQPFTSSRVRLYEALDQFVGRKIRSATLERQEVYNQFFRGNRGRPRPEDLRDTSDQERSANARAALQTLTTATSLLGRIERRRKSVILLSQGLDYDVSGLSSQTGMPSSGISMTPGPLMTGLDGGAIGRALEQVVRLASRANVTFYTIDPRAGDVSDDVGALQAPPDDPSLRLNAQAILSEKLDAQTTLLGLAAQTGGVAFLAPGDVARFDRIARESSEYYLLRYYPIEPLVRGEFREVKVSVKRPDARVSARRGYFARPAGTAAAVFSAPGISPALGAALASLLPADGLAVRVHAAPLRGDRRMAQVAVTTQAPGAVLASGLTADRLETTLEVGVLALEAGTGLQSGAGSLVEVKLEGSALAMLRGTDYRVVTRLPLAPGRYQLRVGVRDRRTDRLGVATIDLVVPDFHARKPMLSGLVLTSKVASAGPTASDAETAQALPVLPTAARRFTTTDELIAGIEVYGAERGRDAITLRTSLEDTQGRRVIEASVAAASAAVDRNGVDGARHVWPLPLHDVPPGRYVLAAELWRNDRKTPLARRETTVFVSGGPASTR
jgi:VWFA-related protein